MFLYGESYMRFFMVLMSMFIVFSGSLLADDSRNLEGQIVVGKTYSYQSVFMNETIQYRVVLPYSYDLNPTKHYPVVYVLDGHKPNVLSVSSTVGMLWGYDTSAPEVIIIGIPSNNRVRDYLSFHSTIDYEGVHNDWLADSGGGEHYHEYLRQEFIPHVEKLYRDNGHRIVVGHSFGGVFVLNEIFSEKPLFQAFIAIDPSFWFGDNFLQKKLEKIPDGGLVLPESIYISNALRGTSANNEISNVTERTKNSRYVEFLKQLRTKAAKTVRIKMQNYLYEEHGSVVPLSHQAGLRYAFEGYLPFQEDPQHAFNAKQVQDTLAKDPSLLIKHYQAYSKRIGVEYPPEERVVYRAADIALTMELYDNAYKLIQINIKNYPKHAYSWEKLGAYYEKIGDVKEALSAFKRAQRLSPDDPSIIAKVKGLSH